MVFGLDFRVSGSDSNNKVRIKLLEEVGSGSYAKVYQAVKIEPGSNSGSETRYYAAKVINVKAAPADFVNKFLPRELEICKQLQHPNIMRTYDVIKQPNKIIMVTDYASKGDLLALCRLVGAMKESQARQIFRQIVLGIEYLHQKSIIHRDLKCENVLICHDERIMIGDFGFARILDSDMVSKTFCGSAAYAAPELLKGRPYNSYSPDIWSLGCILFVMLCHMMPFRDDNMKVLIQEQRSPPAFPNQIKTKLSPPAIELVNKLLTYDALVRPRIEAVRNHVWFSIQFSRT